MVNAWSADSMPQGPAIKARPPSPIFVLWTVTAVSSGFVSRLTSL